MIVIVLYCYHADTSGYYIMTVYDWEQYGDMSDKPSVIKRNIFINVTTTTLRLVTMYMYMY